MTLEDGKPGEDRNKVKSEENGSSPVADERVPRAWKTGNQMSERIAGTQSWADRTDRALEAARASGTPDSWQEVARTADVVADIARTMEIATRARQRLALQEQEAEEAAAHARLAARAAAVAREAAGQLDDIVNRAQTANTPEAWREALESASATTSAPKGESDDRPGRWSNEEKRFSVDFEETAQRLS
jgi:hypothetical protein